MTVTFDQLMTFFAGYNQTIWPAQIGAYLLCLVALLPLLRPSLTANRLASFILALFWVWIGLMFWWPARSSFPPAPFLTAVFALQGILFLVEAIRPRLDYRFTRRPEAIFGLLALAYTLVYPLVGLLFGHAYPQMALSTLFPCPLLTFTFGMLLINTARIPKSMLVIPLMWALSGAYWASLGVWEDTGLFVIGLAGTWLIWRRDRQATAASRIQEVSRPGIPTR